MTNNVFNKPRHKMEQKPKLCHARLRKHLCKNSAGVDGLFCARHVSEYQVYGPLRIITGRYDRLITSSLHFVDVVRNAHYTFDYAGYRVYKLQARGRHLSRVGDGIEVDDHSISHSVPWYIRAVVACQDHDLFVSCVETYALGPLVDMFVYAKLLGKNIYIYRLIQVVDEHVPDAFEALTRLCDQWLVRSKTFTRVLYTAVQRELPTILRHTDPSSLPPFRDLLRITTRCRLTNSPHALVIDALEMCAQGTTTKKGVVFAHFFQTLLSMRVDELTMETLLRSPVVTAYGSLRCVHHLLGLIPRIVSDCEEGPVESYDWIRQQIDLLVPNNTLLTDWVLWHIMRGTEPSAVQFCIRQGNLTSLCDRLERIVVLTTGAKHLPKLVALGLPITVMATYLPECAVDSLIHRLAQKADEIGTYMEALEWLLETDRAHVTLRLHFVSRERKRNSFETPLHTAIWFRQLRTVELLLAYGASPHTLDNPPISYALYRGHTPTLHKLLDYSFETVRDNTQRDGQSELDLLCTRILKYAIDHHNASDATLEWLVEYIVTHNNVYQKSRELVEYAMHQSHPFAVKVLMQSGWAEPPLLRSHPLQNVVDRVRMDVIQTTVQQYVRAADTIVRDYIDS